MATPEEPMTSSEVIDAIRQGLKQLEKTVSGPEEGEDAVTGALFQQFLAVAWTYPTAFKEALSKGVKPAIEYWSEPDGDDPVNVIKTYETDAARFTAIARIFLRVATAIRQNIKRPRRAKETQ